MAEGTRHKSADAGSRRLSRPVVGLAPVGNGGMHGRRLVADAGEVGGLAYLPFGVLDRKARLFLDRRIRPHMVAR